MALVVSCVLRRYSCTFFACAGLLCTRGKQLKVCMLSMPEARKCDKAGKAYLGKLLSGNVSRHVGKMTIAVVHQNIWRPAIS